MHKMVNAFGSRCAIRLAAAGVTAALLAGCSSDVTRLSGDPFGNPFSSASGSTDNRPVASIQEPGGQNYASAQPAASAIESQPLAPPVPRYSATSTPNPPLVAQNSPPAHASAKAAENSGPAGWSADGGTPIVVASGETAGVLAQRYGVPTEALLRANGFSSTAEIRPGTRLVIPVYNAAGAAARPQRLAQTTPHSEAAHAEAKEKVLPTRNIPSRQLAARTPTGETLHFVKGPQPAKAVAEKDEKAKALAEKQEKEKAVAEKAKESQLKAQKAALAEKPASSNTEQKVAELSKQAKVDVRATGSLPPATTSVAAASPEAASPEFRWPAHGRIIQGFKLGGNDGINIAVPEGTAVKAAEDGVVAYAGDELKGYGQLVLIRHPNGFVSAYANNENIMVKRGDTVKRGQVIAKSGQTGNVASPQLHFELRKGSTPVDPTQYLAGL